MILAAVAAASVPETPAAAVASVPEAPAPAEASAEAKAPAEPRPVKITSDRSTYLRKEGVIAFEGNVFVDDPEYKMRANEVNLFLEGTNEVKRVVAIGDVTVTDGQRSGSCAKATYNRALSKIILYGDEKNGIPAKLADNGKRKSEVVGRKIVFWIDSEQVEVEGSTVTVDASRVNMKEGAKSMFGR